MSAALTTLPLNPARELKLFRQPSGFVVRQCSGARGIGESTCRPDGWWTRPYYTPHRVLRSARQGHTPGPWAFDEGRHTLSPVIPYEGPGGLATILSWEGCMVARDTDVKAMSAEVDANKDLLCASPDMLDALRFARSELARLTRAPRARLRARVALAKVDAAIAKATGSQWRTAPAVEGDAS